MNGRTGKMRMGVSSCQGMKLIAHRNLSAEIKTAWSYTSTPPYVFMEFT
jgi:hypothetical protein